MPAYLLQYAVAERFLDLTRLLLDGGAKIDVMKKRNGSTPLCIAACKGYLEIVQLLLERGANPNIILPNAVVNGKPIVLLHLAVAKKLRELIRLLLNAGASIEPLETEYNKEALLNRAVAIDSIELINRVLQAGADINGKAGKLTPLTTAIMLNNYKVVETLLKANARLPNLGCFGLLAPLALAVVAKKHEKVVRLLLEMWAQKLIFISVNSVSSNIL